MPAHLTTDDIALQERASYWNHLVSSVLGRLMTIPQKSRSFAGTITHSQLSSIPIAQVSSTQLRVVRPARFIDDPKEDFFKVNFQLAGYATLSQQKKTTVLEPGSWVIYDNTAPYELCFHSDYQQLLFLVPRRQLLNMMPTVDLHLASARSSRSGMGKLLFDFVASAFRESDSISAEIQPHTARMMLDMLLLGLADSAKTSAALPASSRLTQIQQVIATHLHDPTLSVSTLAQQLHLSKRAIQQLFAQNDTTVQQYIWQQRILNCKRDLATPRNRTHAIQMIASSWGFRSSAHFSRLFKQTTGETPSGYKRRMLRQSGTCKGAENVETENL
ncbi:MAG: helix-turn-helix domain-containing protein [Candidatus Promineifilaceae bacterium]